MTATARDPDPLALPDLSSPRTQVLLAVADDALVTGHRASHWTGVAPSIEEDLAFSTIAQDGISQADLWYQVLLGDTVRRAAVDALGLGREPVDYRHAIVCERPPRDFAYTLARHWVTVRFDQVRLDALSRSSDAEVVALAGKLLHELRYHLDHAEHWFQRLAHAGDRPLRGSSDGGSDGDGDDSPHGRLRAALADVLPEALGLFEPVAGEADAVASGFLPVGHPGLLEPFLEVVAPRLDAVGYGDLAPDDAPPPTDAAGGRAGRHSADFTDDVWPEMTSLFRAHPGARW